MVEPGDKAKPREPVVERVSRGDTVDCRCWWRRWQFCFTQVHFSHLAQPLSAYIAQSAIHRVS